MDVVWEAKFEASPIGGWKRNRRQISSIKGVLRRTSQVYVLTAGSFELAWSFEPSIRKRNRPSVHIHIDTNNKQQTIHQKLCTNYKVKEWKINLQHFDRARAEDSVWCVCSAGTDHVCRINVFHISCIPNLLEIFFYLKKQISFHLHSFVSYNISSYPVIFIAKSSKHIPVFTATIKLI